MSTNITENIIIKGNTIVAYADDLKKALYKVVLLTLEEETDEEERDGLLLFINDLLEKIKKCYNNEDLLKIHETISGYSVEKVV